MGGATNAMVYTEPQHTPKRVTAALAVALAVMALFAIVHHNNEASTSKSSGLTVKGAMSDHASTELHFEDALISNGAYTTQLSLGKKIKKSAKKTSKSVKTSANKASKAIKSTSKKAIKGLKTALNQLGKSGEWLCEKAVGWALGTAATVKEIENGKSVQTECDEMCTEATAQVDVVGGGPEDPVDDGVAANLSWGCSMACTSAFTTLISPATSTVAKDICKKVLP